MPLVGRSRQPARCMNVDLPEPDGPVNATNCPRGISSEMPRSARTSISPTAYVLVRSRTAMRGVSFIAHLHDVRHHDSRRAAVVMLPVASLQAEPLLMPFQ